MNQTMLSMVNVLLSCIEEDTVQHVDMSHPDVKLAVSQITHTNVLIQMNGYWFNRETHRLTPDTISKEVFLPGGCIAVDDINGTYVKRGRRLYDVSRHTFIFDNDPSEESLTVECIMKWDIEELPPVVYLYILASAKVGFYAERGADTQRAQSLLRDANLALFQVQKQHLRYSDPNRLTVNNAATLLNTQTMR